MNINKENEAHFLNLVKTGYLSVSREGKVVNNKTGNTIGKNITSKGYHSIGMKKNGRTVHQLVHRLVYILYGEISLSEEFPIVNHIDGNKSNNNISNLEPSNIIHNRNHAQALGLYDKANAFLAINNAGEKGAAAKLSNEEAKEIRKFYKEGGLTITILADMYGLHKTNIFRIVSNKTYKG